MNIIEIIKKLGINAKKASVKLTDVHNEKKNEALDALKKNLKKFSSEIIDINGKDIENAYSMKLSSAMIDRLTLNEDRINTMISNLNEIINLEDPIGVVLSEWDRPNGLRIKKITVPLGVIGIIFSPFLFSLELNRSITPCLSTSADC